LLHQFIIFASPSQLYHDHKTFARWVLVVVSGGIPFGAYCGFQRQCRTAPQGKLPKNKTTA